MSMCMKARGHCWVSFLVVNCLIFFLRQHFSQNLELTNFSIMAHQQSLSLPLSWGKIGTSLFLALTWALGVWT